MTGYPPPIAALIAQLGSLPTIGNKSAQRLAFHLLSIPEDEAVAVAQAIIDAREQIHLCSICCNLTDSDPCSICADSERDPHMICVVESPVDVLAIERTNDYRGRYHVLHGAISPLRGVSPDQIRLRELFRRLQVEVEVQEVILANNATPEGEATALYIARVLSPAGIKTTRIASGLPVGASLEYADETTLSKAIEGRSEILL
ncbi:MAG: recombination protein RecR [Clostridiaceae bacterium]|mgnify:CR=1 FL=1|nr:recombination protein RecR [Clostridiaceae bacterium]